MASYTIYFKHKKKKKTETRTHLLTNYHGDALLAHEQGFAGNPHGASDRKMADPGAIAPPCVLTLSGPAASTAFAWSVVLHVCWPPAQPPAFSTSRTP